MLRGRDGGILGYIVPAANITITQYKDELANAISELPTLTVSQNAANKGIERGIRSSRCYSIWCAYGKVPIESANYVKDKKYATEFVNLAKPLWTQASEILRRVFPKEYRLFQSFDLPSGLERKAGVWMGMAINAGTSDNPVKCQPHRDVKTAMYGITCLCPLGDFEGGEVILWEMKTVIVLRPRDILFFRDHLVNHSNASVTGVRHSLVAFTRQDMCHWKKRLGEYKDDREEPDKKRQKIWRNEEKYKEDCCLPSRRR